MEALTMTSCLFLLSVNPCWSGLDSVLDLPRKCLPAPTCPFFSSLSSLFLSCLCLHFLYVQYCGRYSWDRSKHFGLDLRVHMVV